MAANPQTSPESKLGCEGEGSALLHTRKQPSKAGTGKKCSYSRQALVSLVREERVQGLVSVLWSRGDWSTIQVQGRTDDHRYKGGIQERMSGSSPHLGVKLRGTAWRPINLLSPPSPILDVAGSGLWVCEVESLCPGRV